MGVYTKLFEKILDSSIWLEPDPTRIVWITLLAAMDEDGFAHFSALENLADRAKVSLRAAKVAVERFQAPDKNSGNPSFGGRRIERVPGGWLVLNADYYRQIYTKAIKLEQNRVRVARFRSKNNNLDNPSITEALLSESEYEIEFESFWKIYPNRKAKGAAYKAWKKLSPDSAQQALLIQAIHSQKQERAALSAAGRFVPDWKYAGTWLNQECWLDEPVKVEDMGHAQTGKLSASERVRISTAKQADDERDTKLIP